MSKQDIKKAITDICDNRLKTLGEYDFFKDASLEIKFWRVTGLVNNDIDGIIDRCEESRLNTLISEFTYYIPSGSAFESSDTPGPGPGPDPHDYSKDYFTLVALENTTININVPDGGVSYSLNDGSTWSAKSGSFTVNVPSGGKLLLKGDVEFNGASQPSTPYIQSTGNYSIEGNIMSLSYEDDFADKKIIQTNNEYGYFFANDTKLISAENLVLPATTLTECCYKNMFNGCSSLTTAPELPATTLEYYCYAYMFSGCTSLTTAPTLSATTLPSKCYAYMFSDCTSLTTTPELPATELANYCYEHMFKGCTALTTAPAALPATTLKTHCYEGMFKKCTSLTTAPELPATTLSGGCYWDMFNDCKNLNYIKALFTTKPGDQYTDQWVFNVAQTGTFIKNTKATWNVRGDDGVPEGWTVESASE